MQALEEKTPLHTRVNTIEQGKISSVYSLCFPYFTQSFGIDGRHLRRPGQQDAVHIHPVRGSRPNFYALAICKGDGMKGLECRMS